MVRLKAFTLAEVLITLGIIGIVAAMTLPALINKIKYREFETALRKNYTVLQQALQLAQLDTGEAVTPNNYQSGYGRRAPIKELLLKYIKKAKDCGTGTEKGACLENEAISGNENINNTYKTFNNKNVVDKYMMDDGQFITTDGTLFLIENSMTSEENTILPIYITVDVNGLKKKPNRWGYDLFTFQLMNDGKLLPVGAEGTKYTPEQCCSQTNTGGRNGISCAYRALTDKNYWNEL